MDDPVSDSFFAVLDVPRNGSYRLGSRSIESKLDHLRRFVQRLIPEPSELSSEYRPLVLIDKPASHLVARGDVRVRNDPLSPLTEIGRRDIDRCWFVVNGPFVGRDDPSIRFYRRKIAGDQFIEIAVIGKDLLGDCLDSLVVESHGLEVEHGRAHPALVEGDRVAHDRSSPARIDPDRFGAVFDFGSAGLNDGRYDQQEERWPKGTLDHDAESLRSALRSQASKRYRAPLR